MSNYAGIRDFLIRYRRQIIGWAVIAIITTLLWVFREHLSGLASVLWPIVVGGAIIGFRRELSDLLKRLRRFGKEGMEFDENRIAAQILALPVEEALRDVAPGETHANFITARVESLMHELNRMQPSDPAKREYLLMLRLAQAQQVRDFQYAWLNIFASQIEALNKMAAENGAVDLTPYYRSHVERAKALSTAEKPIDFFSFEVWCSYFVRMQLATIDQSSGIITEAGRGFLVTATQQNFPRFQVL